MPGRGPGRGAPRGPGRGAGAPPWPGRGPGEGAPRCDGGGPGRAGGGENGTWGAGAGATAAAGATGAGTSPAGAAGAAGAGAAGAGRAVVTGPGVTRSPAGRGATDSSVTGPGDGALGVPAGRAGAGALCPSWLPLDAAGATWPSALGAGDCFGEMAIFEHLPRVASVVAVEESVLLRLSAEHFRRIIEQDPAIAFALFRVLSARLHRFEEDYGRAIAQAPERA